MRNRPAAPSPLKNLSTEAHSMSILVSLTPSESKRLIARAVAAHPLVKKAMTRGRIFISNGTTAGYCAQELLCRDFAIERFACGVVTGGVPCLSPEERMRSIMIHNGKELPARPDMPQYDELTALIGEMGAGDVYIKGANAIDARGNAGFLLAHPNGGSILLALHKVYAQGMSLLIPTGLEKLVASVPDAQRHMKGIGEYSFTFGHGCGYVSVNNGVVIHEITALAMLAGVEAFHAASGGVGGSEGTVTLVAEGTPEQERAAVALLKSIKGEPPTPSWKKKCADCPFRCKYMFQSTSCPTAG